jgi:hypothetical protein
VRDDDRMDGCSRQKTVKSVAEGQLQNRPSEQSKKEKYLKESQASWHGRIREQKQDRSTY